jgi:hypothetical protein
MTLAFTSTALEATNMRRTPRTPNFATFVRFAFVTTFLTFSAVAHAQVIVGPNVNMGGGPAIFTPPSTIIGDRFAQRQTPLFCSPRSGFYSPKVGRP